MASQNRSAKREPEHSVASSSGASGGSLSSEDIILLIGVIVNVLNPAYVADIRDIDDSLLNDTVTAFLFKTEEVDVRAKIDEHLTVARDYLNQILAEGMLSHRLHILDMVRGHAPDRELLLSAILKEAAESLFQKWVYRHPPEYSLDDSQCNNSE